MKDKNFATEFRARRSASGLTQRRVADLCGVSAVTVWNWEHGKSAPWSKDRAGILLAVSGEAAPKTETAQIEEARLRSLKHPEAPAPGRRRLIDNFGDVP